MPTYRRGLPEPGGFLCRPIATWGGVLALGESVRLGKIREQSEEKQTAAADTVQTDATEDTSEMPADEDEESAEEEAVVEPEEDEKGNGKDDADDTWGSDGRRAGQDSLRRKESGDHGVLRRARRLAGRTCRSVRSRYRDVPGSEVDHPLL